MSARRCWFGRDFALQDGVVVAGLPRGDEPGKDSGGAYPIGLLRCR